MSGIVAAIRLASSLVLAAGAAAETAPGQAPRGSLLPHVLEGAYAQVGRTLHYDPRYRSIVYPGGDIPIERGVCSDVIVRAYRHAGVDLQILVHEDMIRSYDSYPRVAGRAGADANIDHRRVANLAVFFRRHGDTLPVTRDAADYRPGDLVTWRLPGGTDHIGLIADRMRDARPLVVHHLRRGVRVDDILFRYPITGHYRYDP